VQRVAWPTAEHAEAKIRLEGGPAPARCSTGPATAALTMRTLGTSIRILVANPQLASQVASIDQLTGLPALATSDDADTVK